jgi:hypothetical protein
MRTRKRLFVARVSPRCYSPREYKASVTRFASLDVGGTTAELPSNTRNRSENVARGRQHAKSHAANFLLERLGKIVNHRFNVRSLPCAAFDLIPAYLAGLAISLVNKRGLEMAGARFVSSVIEKDNRDLTRGWVLPEKKA